jgi:formimidoylglutamate deiminase
MTTPLEQEKNSSASAFLPDLLYAGGRFERGRALVCDDAGRVVALTRLENSVGSDDEARREVGAANGIEASRVRLVRLRGRALLPGMVNAHSHAFQRVIRGRTEYRAARARDSFWTWREMMYAAAARLTPEDLYDASRMAFLEMALGGISAVGEFHYLHRTPSGAEYDDPNLLAKQVVRAALDVGLRVTLLRVAYARAGFRQPPDERQKRFIEADPETYVRHTATLIDDISRDDSPRANQDDAGATRARAVLNPAGATSAPVTRAWVGVAPHSVRAVPLDYLRDVSAFAAGRGLPLHMHVAEQPAEVSACLEETGRTPVALLADEGILGSRFTGVHAIHLSSAEIRALGDARACVCACPTTERNLGDGIVPADALLGAGVPLALGTDSHAQIDLLEDARELEYHLRLRRLERNVLAPAPGTDARVESVDAGQDGGRGDFEGARTSALAARLFECATASGAHSIGAASGELAAGRAADFFTVSLDDPAIAGAGAEDLLPAVVFSLTRAGVREVAVGGRLIVEDGRHAAQEETIARFTALQRRLWGERSEI